MPESVYITRGQDQWPRAAKKAVISDKILRQAKYGDNEAFGLVYEAFFEPIFRFVFRRVGHKETAEDLTEQIFTKAFEQLQAQNGGTTKLSAWLYTIARHTIIDHWRKNQELLSLDGAENLILEARSALDMLSLSAEQALLHSYLDKLPSEQRQVIRLRFIEELNIKETAALLDKSEGNIRIIQYRGLKALKALLPTNFRSL